MEFNEREWNNRSKPTITTWNEEKELKTLMKSQKESKDRGFG